MSSKETNKIGIYITLFDKERDHNILALLGKSVKFHVDFEQNEVKEFIQKGFKILEKKVSGDNLIFRGVLTSNYYFCKDLLKLAHLKMRCGNIFFGENLEELQKTAQQYNAQRIKRNYNMSDYSGDSSSSYSDQEQEQYQQQKNNNNNNQNSNKKNNNNFNNNNNNNSNNLIDQFEDEEDSISIDSKDENGQYINFEQEIERLEQENSELIEERERLQDLIQHKKQQDLEQIEQYSVIVDKMSELLNQTKKQYNSTDSNTLLFNNNKNNSKQQFSYY